MHNDKQALLEKWMVPAEQSNGEGGTGLLGMWYCSNLAASSYF